MCRCTPNMRTPFCGKPGCEWPKQAAVNNPDMITPTPGRVVWYHPGSHESMTRIGDQPLAAIVAGVHSNTMVNLTVFSADGHTFARTSVPLVQADAKAPEGGYAEWMPYQKGQAAKTEELEKQAPAPVVPPPPVIEQPPAAPSGE